MEIALFFLALTLLFGINAWRSSLDGEDYFELNEDGCLCGR
jgi:hypothetical protein